MTCEVINLDSLTLSIVEDDTKLITCIWLRK